MTTRRKAAAEEVAFRPVDNARLAALCGPVDANLRQIETALDVAISRRGESFKIAGPREKASQAAQALPRGAPHCAQSLAPALSSHVLDEAKYGFGMPIIPAFRRLLRRRYRVSQG